MSIQDERLAVIRRVYAEWEAEVIADVEPDPRYAHSGPSQYPETVATLSAPERQQRDLVQRTEQALRDAGLPVVYP